MPASLSLPTPPPNLGFTCRVWIASQLEILHLGGYHYVWFSKDLNPIANGDSSNPLELYREIDRAVKRNDVNHPKLKDLKANLLLAVTYLIAPSDAARARELKRSIRRASIDMFRPQLWKLDLSRINATRWNKTGANLSWDEQYVTDLKGGEFEVIVD
jgi:hypothetical protein